MAALKGTWRKTWRSLKMNPGDLVSVRYGYKPVIAKVGIIIEKNNGPPWHHWHVLTEGKSLLLPLCFIEVISESR